MNPVILIFTTGLCAVLVPYVRGSCFVIPAKAFRLIPGELADSNREGCKYEGETIQPNSGISRECLKCYCSRRGDLYCCDERIRITEYPSDCKVIDDGCSQKAVKIYNEKEECVVGVSAVV